MKKLTVFALLFAALTAFSGPYDAGWTKYRSVTVNTTTAAVAGSVANFPLLVRLTNVDAVSGSDVLAASATGADVRFTDSAGATALSYQVERWTTAAAEIWVKVPSIPGSASATIRMYWGNGIAVSASDGGAVFDTANGFRSVWHMGDAAAQSPRPNATVYSTLTATPRNFPNGFSPSINGVIGKADSIIGGPGGPTADVSDGAWMTVDSGTATDAYRFPGGRFTATFWANHYALAGNSRHYHMLSGGNNGAAPENAIQSIPSNNATNNLYFRYRTGGTYVGGNAGGLVLVTNTWQHIANVVSRGPTADTLIKYVNGVENNRVTNALQMADTARTFVFFGRAFEQGNDVCVSAVLDEMAFANSTRSAAWIKLSYETQKPGVTAVTLGTTQSTASVPGAPTAVSGVAGNGQVSVSWTAPASNGGATITAYTATSNPGNLTCATTGTLTCLVLGLSNGTPYTFTVTATNIAGTGPASAASAPVTPVAPLNVPGQPPAIQATAGNAQAVVAWVAPGSPGGSAISSYIVTSNPDARTCTTTVALTCTVTTLTNGIPYTFTVVAINSFGPSAASPASTPVTPIGQPGAPAAPTGVAGNASVVVTFAAPLSNGGSAVTGYTVTAAPGGATCTSAVATTLTCTVTGLTNGTPYTFTVMARNVVGLGPASPASVAVTPVAGPSVPGAPTGVSLISNPGIPPAGVGSILVTWVAPASNGGATITGYTATATGGTTGTCTTTGALSCEITNLTSFPYTVTVRAINSAGTGAASTPVTTGILTHSSAQGFGFQMKGSMVVFSFPRTLENLRISVMDSRGRTVWSQRVAAGVGELVWNGKTAQGGSIHGVHLMRVVTDMDGKSKILAENKIALMP